MIAPAKLNLCLYLGRPRSDGLHQLCSIFHPLSLADRITVSEADADEIVCDGVEGPNLAETALAALREAGWGSPPLRIEIEKRIPVAAGLGGGSADAAAVLRLAAGEVEGLAAIAAEIGADVPSQLDPAPALVGGAGEKLEELPEPGEYGVVLIPDPRGLSTADVYAEADRLGLGRDPFELEAIAARLREAAAPGASPLEFVDLLANDLGRAAIALRPEIEDALAALSEVGAEATLVTGSGPTAVGLFPNLARADAAAAALPAAYAAAIVSAPDRFV